MNFILFTDSSCNLSCETLTQNAVRVVPLTYQMGEESYTCYEEGAPFNSKAFFERQRGGALVRTSLINSDTFVHAFEPVLQEGHDIVYISISSGVSGTYQSAVLAAEELNAKYTAKVYLADSLSGSYGEGFMVLHAARMRDMGACAMEVVKWVEESRLKMCHILSVDDLNFLKRGGRLPSMAAAIGTMLDIKPLLGFNNHGNVFVLEKVRGKNRALSAMVKRYGEKALEPNGGEIAIVHGDCIEEARCLAGMLQQTYPFVSITTACFEPTIGAHVGPGALAIVFWGTER